jgi:Flp pilus assembly protein TadD|tara:strand:- start:42 stop:320 length:279 start_codon:yes stop_codon:yes gene_type:complete
LREQAVADYSHALEIEPANANAFHNRGTTLDKMGRLKEAINDFSAAIRLDPRNAASYNSRALAYDKKGLAEGAPPPSGDARKTHPGIADFTR